MPLTQHGKHDTYGIPPDAAGKRMSTLAGLHLRYENGVQEFSKGDTLVGQQSGTRGIAVEYIEPSTTLTGQVLILFEADTPAFAYTVGENLIVNGSTVAQVAEIAVFHTQSTTIAGGNNPANLQFVDERGAAYFRYSEGEQQLDSFGLSRFTTPTQLAQYFFTFDLIPEDVQVMVSGGGQAQHIPTQASARLVVGDVANDKCVLMTHKYHPYQAGYGQLAEMTVCCGDTGKVGLSRRWGYFDEQDGCFFEQRDGVIYCVVRSSSDGSSNDDVVVPQSQWNVDKLDGSEGLSNLSKMLLDPTTLNIYWVDVQWLGAGRVRFGVFDEDGSRVTVHVVQNANRYPRPYMRTGKLPLRAEIENRTATASGSELKLTCMAVKTEGHVNDTRARRTRKFSGGMSAYEACAPGVEKPLLSFRSRSLIGAGNVINRLLSVPELMALSVKDQPIVLRLYKGATLTDPSFVAEGTSAVELDQQASATAGGRCLLTWVFAPGQHSLPFPDNFGLFGESMFLNADGTHGPIFTFTAEPLELSSAQVRMFVTWIDLE